MKVCGIFIGFLLRSKGFPDNAMETLKQKLKRGSAAPGTESVTMTDVYLRADLEAGHQYNNNREGDYEPVLPPKGVSILSAQQKHFKSLSNSSSDSDYLGTCVKCGERIIGEGMGCSAMGRPYHIHCFTCSGERLTV